jgi:hypothetical protein
MRRALAAIALVLLLLVAGCGGDDGGFGTSTTQSQGQAGQGTAPAGKEPATPEPNGGGTGNEGAGGSNGGDSGEAAKVKDIGGEKVPPGAPPAEPKEFKAPRGGDDSIQTYGDAAESSEEEEIIAAMRSFFAAMAAADYPAICAGLTSANRETLEQFLKLKKEEGDCETVLAQLRVERTAPEARKAANGTVYQVRVEDETAFILFTPEGGKPSYFVMKGEDDGWKATGLTTGTPFDPLAQ